MKKQLGFTLIEVMIVVVIVAILAAVAIPSYQDSIRKTRRAEAKEALTSIAALQERYFFTNNSYADDLSKLGITNNQTENGYYTLSLIDPLEGDGVASRVLCGPAPSYPCFKVKASPPAGTSQYSDTKCRQMTISHTGKKEALDDQNAATTTECW